MTSQERITAKVKIAKPFMNEEIIQSVSEILRSGLLVQGKFVKEFETRIATYLGSKHVLALNSGTAALHVSIEAVKEIKSSNGALPDSPKIITSTLSFAATANAALAAGCTPILTDVDEETFNIKPELIEEKMDANVIAIEPVDVYGLPAELARINSYAKSKNVAVVEDAAEAIGAAFENRKIGTISDVTCFSTYATKNLHTGEGGFVSTDDDLLAEKVTMLRSQGQSSRYRHEALGYNYRMLEIAAAIGLPQITLIDELNSRRRENALILLDGLSKVEALNFQRVDDAKAHAWYMFAALLDEKKAGMSRNSLVLKLRESGIEADVSWPTPIHLQPYYRNRFGFKEGDLPIAERICNTVFQLPIHPFLTRSELERIIYTVKETLAK